MLQGPPSRAIFAKRPGSPIGKALRYHLFRLHQVPIGKPDSSRAAFSSPPALSQTSPGNAVAVSGPAGVSSPTHPANSFPLVREGDTLLVDFPLTGSVTCTEAGCSRQFVAKTWSVKKHLRFFHNIPITSSRLRCGMCSFDVCKPIKNHSCFTNIEPYVPNICSQWQCDSCQMSFPGELNLRNNLDCHKRAGLRAAAPKLSLPVSSSKKSRRKRAKQRSTADIGEPSVVQDSDAVLAQPITQEPLSLDNIVPEDDTPGPLSHFIEVFDGLLGDHPSTECFAAFVTLSMLRLLTSLLRDRISVCLPLHPRLHPPTWKTAPPVRSYIAGELFEKSFHPGDRCKIPLLSLQTFFSESWEGGTSDPLLYGSTDVGERAELLDTDFSEKEVWEALKKAESTAPGPDRLTYHHLRLVDPGAKLLSRIFTLCLRFPKVPSSWKSSTTILIPKGGDPMEVSN
ncbi:retrovirus-related Pol polyprotein from type-2 retrotransposable element R2DM [Caerostris darwini]|uniref:Retrovirus-related Pol polyprotein from type-2 retrotransposable element R2DM n=1 Tax=Caerostris darwini TaxID=1538125 RepID=A0AAV4SEL7_9ARAC|nr:retrovirus-related Pol polyprotein from type-2 retrotransposable element R2DM [Caerostris darwini]